LADDILILFLLLLADDVYDKVLSYISSFGLMRQVTTSSLLIFITTF